MALTCLLATAACQPGPTAVPTPVAESVQIAGQTYPTQLVGQQRWTTVNYAGPGGVAYETGATKADYGRYYRFDEVKAIPVPAGWRIPTLEDYVRLAQSQGVVVDNYRATRQEAIKKLLSTTHWRTTPGTNASGFNAYPTGYISQDRPPQDGYLAEFWTVEGQSMSIQEHGPGTHTLSFYVNDHDPTARFTVRVVSDQ